MKKAIFKIVFTSMIILLVFSCSNHTDEVGPTQIDTTTPPLNETDLWLRQNFVYPYNIEVLYKWDINDSDFDKYLHPPYISSVKPVAEALLKAWIEPYSQAGGADFIKKIAPRQFVFIGNFDVSSNSPTIKLGLAEAGMKITIFGIDELDFTNLESVRKTLKTIQHEYAHILNQNIPFDVAFGKISPESYTAQWYNRSDTEARELGCITAYASSEANEDFAEMVSEMLTHSKAEFDAIVDGISSTEAKTNIREKEAMVVEYYKKYFDIDIYELQVLTDAATQELIN